MPIDRDEHRVVGTCGVCGGPVVIYTGPWQSRERVCRHCGVSPTAQHIDKCQCPEHAPLQYRRTACEGAVEDRDVLTESLRAALLRESQEKAWRLALEARAEKAEAERDTLEAERDRIATRAAENFARAVEDITKHDLLMAQMHRLISKPKHPDDQR